MSEEIVTISADGQRWTGFTDVHVHASFSHAARSFGFKIAAEFGVADTLWRFAAGTPIEIFLSNDLVCRGYVDRYQSEAVGHKKADISISGRSRAQDFIDSAAIHDTGEFLNKTPLEIAQALDKFGVGITSDQTLDKVPVYRITPGETAFNAVEKLARSAGVWLSGQADGSISITVAGQGRNSPVIEGKNMLAGKVDHNWANRHSHVIVRGQRVSGSGPQAMEISAESHDSNLQRFRPTSIVHDGDTDKDRVKVRADHRRDSEAGNSLKAHVSVQGFHDEGGKLWSPGNLVFLESPALGVAQDMAISSIEFEQSRTRGSLSQLSLVDPRALGAKSGRKGGKQEKSWASTAGYAD
ncbi:MAG TPA: hypothetical protein VIJ52_05400 [Pseudolabrys sp.]|nr:hypothetical protein [Pseudolabrys sp.]